MDVVEDIDHLEMGTKNLPCSKLFCHQSTEDQEAPALVFRFHESGSGPGLLRQVFEERGWVEYDNRLQKRDDWNIWWRSAHFNTRQYEDICPWQRLNHFPKTTAITKKDDLVRNLRRMQCVHGSNVFNFIPLSFNLPNDYHKFLKAHKALCKTSKGKNLWICKPVDLCCGRGIFIFQDLSDLLYDCGCVVQQYIDNPLLIGGYKFDLRIYVAVTAFHPLVAYIYEEGIVRFGTEKFDLRTTNNIFAHLTNSSINKHSPGYMTDKQQVGAGCKWTLTHLRCYFLARNIDDQMLWRQIVNIVILTLLTQASQVPKVKNCFELFGFDILLDETLKPWLLEVNCSPSLVSDCQVDVVTKKQMLHDLIDLVGLMQKDCERGKKICQRSHVPRAQCCNRNTSQDWKGRSSRKPKTCTSKEGNQHGDKAEEAGGERLSSLIGKDKKIKGAGNVHTRPCTAKSDKKTESLGGSSVAGRPSSDVNYSIVRHSVFPAQLSSQEANPYPSDVHLVSRNSSTTSRCLKQVAQQMSPGTRENPSLQSKNLAMTGRNTLLEIPCTALLTSSTPAEQEEENETTVSDNCSSTASSGIWHITQYRPTSSCSTDHENESVIQNTRAIVSSHSNENQSAVKNASFHNKASIEQPINSVSRHLPPILPKSKNSKRLKRADLDRRGEGRKRHRSFSCGKITSKEGLALSLRGSHEQEKGSGVLFSHQSHSAVELSGLPPVNVSDFHQVKSCLKQHLQMRCEKHQQPTKPFPSLLRRRVGKFYLIFPFNEETEKKSVEPKVVIKELQRMLSDSLVEISNKQDNNNRVTSCIKEDQEGHGLWGPLQSTMRDLRR